MAITGEPIKFREPIRVGPVEHEVQINFPDVQGRWFVGALNSQEPDQEMAAALAIGDLGSAGDGKPAYRGVVRLSADDARALGEFLIEQSQG
ncbi:hypothetical protein ACWEOE_10845 [Amycolatopsis sp. NPDC004368]